MPALGLQGVRARLGQRLGLPTRGLAPALQRLLRTVGVFDGGFGLDLALQLGQALDLDESGALDGPGQRADHSLLRLEATGETPRLRLLETSRAFARDQLGKRGELARVRQCHAQAVCARLAGNGLAREQGRLSGDLALAAAEQALALLQRPDAPAYRADLMVWRGTVLALLGRQAEAVEARAQALPLCAPTGNDDFLFMLLCDLAGLESLLGLHAAAGRWQFLTQAAAPSGAHSPVLAPLWAGRNRRFGWSARAIASSARRVNPVCSARRRRAAPPWPGCRQRWVTAPGWRPRAATARP